MQTEILAVLSVLVVLTIDIGVRVAALGIIPNNRKPSEATAWLLAVFFVPLLGILVFLLLGHSKLSRKRRAKQRAINDAIYKNTLNKVSIAEENAPPSWFMSIATLNSRLGAMPLVGGNDGKLVQDYKESLRVMAEAIDEAKDYVHVEFYIMSLDKTTKQFFDSLKSAQKRGVTVRVLFDHVGSLQYPDYKATLAFLEKHSIAYKLMLPVMPLKGKFQRPDLRNHRKLLVVDGKQGFMGSQNIIDSSYNKKKNIKRGLHWFELMVNVQGPVVYELDAVFAGDWYAETDELLETHIDSVGTINKDVGNYDCQVVPSGPGFEEENNLKLFTSLIYAAQQKVIITSPYFVPDESMLTAITTAAQRGVRVELFVSEIGDQLLVYHAQRSYYEALLRAGVHIYMYSSPTVLHAKHFTVDDAVSVIGSSNMDMRSFNLNMEISLLVYSEEFTSSMREVEAGYKANSKELGLDVWLKRPLRHKFIDNVARLTSSLQ
jgi:cardiolipin synthase